MDFLLYLSTHINRRPFFEYPHENDDIESNLINRMYKNGIQMIHYGGRELRFEDIYESFLSFGVKDEKNEGLKVKVEDRGFQEEKLTVEEFERLKKRLAENCPKKEDCQRCSIDKGDCRLLHGWTKKGDVYRHEYPLLGEYLPNLRKVVLYVKNIEDACEQRHTYNGVLSTYIHELFHAYFHYVTEQKQAKCNYIREIEEAMTEFSTLVFLRVMEKTYDSDEWLEILEWAKESIGKKQETVGNLPAYGLGLCLFENLSEDKAFEWINKYAERLGYIDEGDEFVKRYKQMVCPCYPIEPEKALEILRKILFETDNKPIKPREVKDNRNSKMSQTDGSICNYIDALCNSTMFHMSLGSKELFHSNFLHWISIVNWSAFLKILHGLADTEKFWWEKIECDVKGYEGNYCPEKKNIKVFREHRKFDLSIYILDSEKEVKDSSNSDNVSDDDTTVYAHDPKGKKMVQKWIPVLVLENKMKSLPYKAQLEEYTQKAFEEWRKGEKLIRPNINELKQNSKDREENVPQDWITNHGITFILLSLMDTNIGNSANYEIHQTLSYKKKGNRSLKFSHKWKHKTYRDLVGFLNMIDLSTFSTSVLNQNVLDDYINFLNALCGLAKTWKIIPKESYRSQIFPWNVNAPAAQEKRQEIEQYKELRIHDIHEKLLYEQLLNMLEIKLKEEGFEFERHNSKTYQDDVKIFTNSNYLHGVGMVEAFFDINKDLKLLIEVQGDRYCHMVVCDKIVFKEKDSKGKKTLSVNLEAIKWDICLKPLNDTFAKYISINNSNPTFKWDKPAWGQYGENNIYQYVLIPPKATIKDVVDAMITDLQNIKEWFK